MHPPAAGAAGTYRPSAGAGNAVSVLTPSVTDPVTRLLETLMHGELAPSAIQQAVGIKHRPTFRANYLRPALEAGFIEPTLPDKPNSRLQRYRLTPSGQQQAQPLKTQDRP